jgi:drug/metabolite transporter (DMT)-like permease
VAAAVAYACSSTAASLAYHGGSNPHTVAALRFVVPTIALIVWLRASCTSLLLSARDSWIAFALGAITALYTLAWLSSLNEIPLAPAVLVFYLFPLLAALILGVCGWEKFSWQSGVAILVAFGGLALALDPRGHDLNIEGLLLAFAAALGLALVVTISSRVFRSGDSRPLTLYMATFAAVLLSALCAVRGQFVFPATTLGWIGFVGAAVSYGFAMISFFVAMSIVGPVRVSLLSYTEPVITAGLGVVVLGEPLSAVQIAGIALVIVALIGATLVRNLGAVA